MIEQLYIHSGLCTSLETMETTEMITLITKNNLKNPKIQGESDTESLPNHLEMGESYFLLSMTHCPHSS